MAQGHRCSDDDRGNRHNHSQPAQQNRPNGRRLMPDLPSCELVSKEVDALIVADLIKAQPTRENTAARLQGRFLQAGEKLLAPQQHPGRVLAGAMQKRGADLLQLLIRKPVGLIEDEERRIPTRCRPCPSSRRQGRDDRTGAEHTFGR
jgi:hypothetical protein